MDFLMELPLEIGRPTGPEKDPEAKDEDEEQSGDEKSQVIRMVEGCADNWEFKDWKKVRVVVANK